MPRGIYPRKPKPKTRHRTRRSRQERIARNPIPEVLSDGIRLRAYIIADALRGEVEITAAEINAASADMNALVAFAERVNASLDWLVVGDVRPLLRSYRRHRR